MVPPVIIHFRSVFSLINHPAIGVPHFRKPPCIQILEPSYIQLYPYIQWLLVQTCSNSGETSKPLEGLGVRSVAYGYPLIWMNIHQTHFPQPPDPSRTPRSSSCTVEPEPVALKGSLTAGSSPGRSVFFSKKTRLNESSASKSWKKVA